MVTATHILRLTRTFSLSIVVSVFAASALAATDRPNIVFVLCDDLRYDALGCMGNQVIQTPHIDALAKEGVVFENAFATTAICMTSRANILTGMYAARTGLRHGSALSGRSLTEKELQWTYPWALKTAGYRTAYVGKWHLGKPPEGLFDVNAAYAGQGEYWGPGQTKHLTEQIGDQAVDVIRTSPPQRPLLLAIGFKAPHVQDGFEKEPYPPPPSVGTLYETVRFPPPSLSDPAFFAAQPKLIRESIGRQRWEYRLGPPDSLNFQRSMRRYYRLVSGVDLQIGRIVAALEESGRARNTVVVLTSDQGVFLGARGLAGKWLGHEPSIRIPLVIYDPRFAESVRGTRPAELALTIDLAPTLIEFGGGELAAGVQGRSLVPLIHDRLETPWRSEFFYEYHYDAGHRIPRSEGVRSDRYKYLRYLDSQPLFEELYDLDADPEESTNLALSPSHVELLEEMREKWATWRQRVR